MAAEWLSATVSMRRASRPAEGDDETAANRRYRSLGRKPRSLDHAGDSGFPLAM